MNWLIIGSELSISSSTEQYVGVCETYLLPGTVASFHEWDQVPRYVLAKAEAPGVTWGQVLAGEKIIINNQGYTHANIRELIECVENCNWALYQRGVKQLNAAARAYRPKNDGVKIPQAFLGTNPKTLESAWTIGWTGARYEDTLISRDTTPNEFFLLRTL
jgi:hypothetical protein